MPTTLYHLELQKSDTITTSVSGSFSAAKAQEVCASRGNRLELLRVDQNGHVITVNSTPAFSVVRSLCTIRLPGSGRDYLVLASDAGRICILQFENGQWKRIHMETFGRSGCRRVVPGQYLCSDPRGRAVMVSAVEKQRFVYILNRDLENNLTISSPLEAHKSNSVVFSTCGVDVGFENPVFATLEWDHSNTDEDPEAESEEKMLVYYELDLGLNHVLRKWATPVEVTSNLLIPVPGGTDGPSGVLVCSENYITYKHSTQEADEEEKQVAIPRRQDVPPDHGLLIVSFAAHKQKGMFFFLVQSEYGDIFKVTLDYGPAPGSVTDVKLKYFDTIPVATSLNLLRAGFMFAPSEFGNRKLYQFQSLGDDDDDGIIGYITIGREADEEGQRDEEDLPLIRPRPLKNLLMVDDINTLNPLLDCKIENLSPLEDKPQLYCVCGRGPQSTLRVLRHGLSINELAVSELPGVPSRIWAVKKNRLSEFDDYIVVSFVNATLVLAVGEQVEEAQDTGFDGSITTLHCGAFHDDSMIQVHAGGVRHIRRDGRLTEWKSTGKVTHAAQNTSQLLVARGKEVLVFELELGGALADKMGGTLAAAEITCMDLAPVQPGRQRAKFAAIGFLDNQVRVYSLDNEMTLVSRLVCPANPDSVVLCNMPSETGARRETLYLMTGLANGMLQRFTIDDVTGDVKDPRSKLCGARNCKLVKVSTQGKNSVLALSTTTWLCYFANNKFNVTPLGDQTTFEHASPLASEPCPEGLVTIQNRNLRILAIEHIGDSIFSQTITNLKCTPRQFAVHPQTNFLILLETDHRCYNDNDKQKIIQAMKESVQDSAPVEDLAESEYGAVKATAGIWASYVRVYDPYMQTTHDMIELEDNQAAFSCCLCQFEEYPSEWFLVVGAAVDLMPNPRSHKGGVLLTFKFSEFNRKLELVHKTQCEEIPQALCSFQGKLLAGVGGILRLYSMGRRRLLRKCENRNFPTSIMKIECTGDRIMVGDSAESVLFCKFWKRDNQLTMYADGTTPRWTSAFCVVDYQTVAVADKFGNVTLLRLREGSGDHPPPKGAHTLLASAPPTDKAEELCNFHVGDIVTSIKRTSLGPSAIGGATILVYTTLMGSIGTLVPLQTRDDADFFQLLEMHMRQENPPFTGRDHLTYRSASQPVKNVIDGDFCEQYTALAYEKQKAMAEELDRTPEDICRRLEEMRNQVL